MSAAGRTATAGASAAGSGGTAGAAGGGATGTCQKGMVKASEVVFIGESFIAQTGAIPRLTTKLARDAGTIGASESYRSAAVSGTQLTTGAIPMQFTSASAASPVKVVLMDGGGNDLLFGTDRCMGSYDARCKEVVDVVHDLFMKMKASGVKDVVYFFYPDPMGIGANIKAAMDILRPEMQKECEGSTDVRCVWVDQRESWEGNYSSFTSDGIHPTEAGATASAKQIWDAMVAHCIAQ
jgi:lysophospholipase L1-like esterase